MNKFSRIILAAMMALTACQANKGLVLDYEFTSSEGAIVKDLGPNHIDAVLMNEASVADGVLVLGTGEGYLDMTAAAGELFSTLGDFSVMTRYFLSPDSPIRGYGHFLWCFSQKEANAEKEGPYHAFRINEQRCETSTGGWSNETGIQLSKVSDSGRWISVVFRQAAGVGELVIDGVCYGPESGFPEPKAIFQDAPAFNWIGRPPFNGDRYLHGVSVDCFRVYDRAVADDEISKFLAETNKMNQ